MGRRAEIDLGYREACAPPMNLATRIPCGCPGRSAWAGVREGGGPPSQKTTHMVTQRDRNIEGMVCGEGRAFDRLRQRGRDGVMGQRATERGATGE